MNQDETIGFLREENRRLRIANDASDRVCAANVQARQVLGEAKDTVEQAKDGWTKAQIDWLVNIINRATWILEGK